MYEIFFRYCEEARSADAAIKERAVILNTVKDLVQNVALYLGGDPSASPQDDSLRGRVLTVSVWGRGRIHA